MPGSHREWARAMQNELAYVDGRDQPSWFAGALWAAFAERLRHPDFSPARVLLSLAILSAILGDLFPTALTAVYKLNILGWAWTLGSFTVGGDYRRLIPLMDAIPVWLHAMMLAACACYLVAIAQIVYRFRAAYLAILLAFGIETLANYLGDPIIEATGVRANPKPSMIALVLPILFPVLLAACSYFLKPGRDLETQPRP
jgi:hypothetical protein